MPQNAGLPSEAACTCPRSLAHHKSCSKPSPLCNSLLLYFWAHSLAAHLTPHPTHPPTHVLCRFTPEELAPFLQPLLEKLFAAFAFPESGENEYLMKCVMRVITFVGAWGFAPHPGQPPARFMLCTQYSV